MDDQAAFNRALGLKINQEVWNRGELDKIPDYFSEDFVMDYSPNFVRRGRDQLRGAVERSHAAFDNFREDVKLVIADDTRVVIHFTIRGRHTGQWGPLLPSGKDVEFDEIVIMTIRDGKVVHQTGVIDNVTGLRQVGVLPSL